MEKFPVTKSLLSSKAIAQFLIDNYSLSKDTKCFLIKSGINDTYSVTSSSVKFVFRIYCLNWRSKEEINEEIRLLNLLNEYNIPVSFPIKDNKNKYLQTLNAPEGARYALLFTFAEGEKLHNFTVETHFQIGQLIAKLHKVTLGKTLNRTTYTPDILLVNSLQNISQFLSDKSEEIRFMHKAQKYLLSEFENADLTNIRSGIVHLDIWFDNINITHDNKVTFFDFDFCGNGWLCLDLAYYVLQLHNIEKYEPENYEPKVKSFLNGYESIFPISDEERRLIPMLGVCLYYFYLGVQCYRYDDWSNSFLNESYLKRFINGLVKRYYDIYGLGC